MYNPQITPLIIKNRAEILELSLTDLNKICGLNKNTIATSASSKYGLGAGILYTIADALNCSVDYLLGRNSPEFSSEHTELMHLFDTLADEDKEIIAKLIVKLSQKG